MVGFNKSIIFSNEKKSNFVNDFQTEYNVKGNSVLLQNSEIIGKVS